MDLKQLRFKKLHPDAALPSYAKAGDAGLDLQAIDAGTEVDGEYGRYEYREYGTGLAVEIPEGYVGLVFPRSSISKTGLALCNAVGVIDSGYRGEIRFRFRNGFGTDVYSKFDRIGQLVVIPYPQWAPEWADELSGTPRGEGGFGSSGK